MSRYAHRRSRAVHVSEGEKPLRSCLDSSIQLRGNEKGKGKEISAGS